MSERLSYILNCLDLYLSMDKPVLKAMEMAIEDYRDVYLTSDEGTELQRAATVALKRSKERGPYCEDCGQIYGGENWLDMVLPNDQWELISGHSDGSGILCAGCIVKRAANLETDNGQPIFSACKTVFE